MDRRTLIAAFVAILLLILLGGRKGVAQLVHESGLEYQGKDSVNKVPLPGLTLDDLGGFKRGPAFWTQTTGLMCNCSRGDYSAPFVIRAIEIPQPPEPHYVYFADPGL